MNTTEQLLERFLAFPKVFTDTRKVVEGGIFFALKGERFDGNQFAAQALEQGAALAVVDDENVVANEESFFLVANVLLALQDLARAYRKTLDIPFIGITGSNGKTTTKELVSRVLSQKYRLFYTKGNLNNHIGVPLTILSIPFDTEMAVIEMGANHVGEIAMLSSIAMPSHGLITNIGKAHLEGFGGVEGIKKGKSELYDFLAANNGVAFINENEKFLTDLSSHVADRIFYGKGSDPKMAVTFDLAEIKPFLRVDVDKRLTIHSNLVGQYNFNNIITAIALGFYFNIEQEEIKQAIESYIPSNNRSQVIQQASNKIILDAYNANPTSMMAALNYFDSLESANKIVMLGDMLELGEYAAEEHLKIIQETEKMEIKKGLFVGPIFKRLLLNHPYFMAFDHVEELKKWWNHQDTQNALILIKGSRGIKLEKVLEDN